MGYRLTVYKGDCIVTPKLLQNYLAHYSTYVAMHLLEEHMVLLEFYACYCYQSKSEKKSWKQPFQPDVTSNDQ